VPNGFPFGWLTPKSKKRLQQLPQPQTCYTIQALKTLINPVEVVVLIYPVEG
jgi:hypothetical protein